MLLLTRDRAPEHKFLLSQVRQGIETTFGQLWWQFVDRVFSRSWRGLWNLMQLKVLFYGACGNRHRLSATQDWGSPT